jgi:hypothetical protein
MVKLVDFTATPGPRYVHEGAFSGQEWRDEYLLPAFQEALKAGTKLHVDLDGAEGFASSFVEEAFGGLVRETKLNYRDVAARLEIRCDDEPGIIELIFNKYLPDADKPRERRFGI